MANVRYYNRNKPIPGVSGKRMPGRAPRPHVAGFHYTNVPSAPPYDMGSDVFREYHRQQIRDVRGRFAGGWGFAWQGLEGVADAIENANRQNHQDIGRAAQQLADEMLQWARENAPWQDDDTNDTNARESLQAAVVWDDKEHFTIFLGHGSEIYYGIWLEVRWGGRYAIILPTIYHFAPHLGEKIRTMT